MKQLEECHQILKDPDGYVKRFKAETGRKVVGYFCSYAPEEIILAAGVHPYRLFGSGEKIRLAEAHLQSYCCSLVRGALEDALSGRLAFLDGVVFPHTCDSIQRLSDIWRLNIPYGFHTDVVLPVKLNTDSAREYMINVLKAFRADYIRDLPLALKGMHRFLPALARMNGAIIRQIPVNHRPRKAGRTKYTNLGRLKETIGDLNAVRWMQKRHRRFEAREI